MCFTFCIGSLPEWSAAFRERASASNLELKRNKREDDTIQITAGSTFASHYRLLDVFKPDGELPGGLNARYRESLQIGRGSFGEAWKAVDTRTGQFVVLKFFKSPVGLIPGGDQYLTWHMAENNHKLSARIRRAAEECQLALDMQLFRNVSPEDREAASHIMKCKEDHVKMPVSATGHVVGSSDILYHIFEFVGDDTLGKWMAKALNDDSPIQYVDRSLYLFKQLLHVLRYFSGHRKQWVHHDLKPSNIVVRKGADGLDHMTVIDVGSATEVSEENAKRSLESTLEYSPAEGWDLDDLVNGQDHARTLGYDFEHISSFDMYSAGVIFDEMLTGILLPHKILKAEVNSSELKMIAQWAESCHNGSKLCPSKCKKLCVFHAINRPGGCAQRYLKHFSDRVIETSDDAHSQVSSEFLQRAKTTSWYTTFRRMVAYDSSDRATPVEVLASDLFKNSVDSRSPSPLVGRKRTRGRVEGANKGPSMPRRATSLLK